MHAPPRLVMTVVVCALLLAAGAAHAQPGRPPVQRIQFNRDVRPILADKCWSCHGFDKAKRKAGLRLDLQEAALSKLPSGAHGIVAGDPAKSTVWQRIVHADPDERMPPADGPKHLTAAEKETLRRWIAEGAVWQPHWAYIAPQRAPLPAVKNVAWARGAIDRFVLARLDREGLAPSPVAAKHTLLRRLSFDLVGLPPTAEELDAFVRDDRTEAYEAAVDRLLASPHYGERMAIQWLDLVRYADTIGYHSDNERNVSLFRDYVIRSFNENEPFDQFTLEQLAGDLLPSPTFWQRVASGYNRLLQTTEEGGAQPKEYAQKYLADRVRNASSAWMAATMGCAQCHDHKYDPYSLKDFYRFAAFFADVNEPAVGRREAGLLPADGEQAEALATVDREVATLKKILETDTPALERARRRWERTIRPERDRPSPAWTTLEPADARSDSSVKLLFMSNQDSFEVNGPAAAKDVYTVTMNVDQDRVTGFRLEAMVDNDARWRGPGRTPNGAFAVTALTLRDAATGERIAVKSASASAGAVRPTRHGIAWTVREGLREHESLVVELIEPRDLGDGGRVVFVIEQNAGGNRTLGRFRISATSAPDPRARRGRELSREVLEALARPEAERSAAETQRLVAYHRSIAPSLAATRRRLVAREREREAVTETIPKSLTTKTVEPQTVRVLPRGDWMNETGEVVTPGVPAFLPPIAAADGERATRLDLARWMTAPENPLTARVFVNRVWKLFFGQGLSKDLEDFGAQGELPSHPELLDWLAVEFRESGWDVKRLVRMIVTSSTYRQASVPTRHLVEKDPYNRLLARQSRFRLDAELVRDNALAASGLLSPKIGGPSVKPYQPDGYWAFLNFPVRDWTADVGEAQYRRGLYTWWQRAFLHPSLLAFDAPTREECTADRTRSNIPQQALVLLNDPTYVEAARVFAARILRQSGDTAQRLRWAYLRALSRAPSPEETRALSAMYEKHLAEYRADPEAARGLLGVGNAPLAPELDRAQLAAWTSVTRALLATHETITRP